MAGRCSLPKSPSAQQQAKAQNKQTKKEKRILSAAARTCVRNPPIETQKCNHVVGLPPKTNDGAIKLCGEPRPLHLKRRTRSQDRGIIISHTLRPRPSPKKNQVKIKQKNHQPTALHDKKLAARKRSMQDKGIIVSPSSQAQVQQGQIKEIDHVLRSFPGRKKTSNRQNPNTKILNPSSRTLNRSR
jgi:hypothetical protein